MKSQRHALVLKQGPLGSWINSWQSRGLMLAAALACATLAGCASHRHHPPEHHPPAKPVGYPCGPCAGYFPTCWRPWPDVCPSCPVFGIEEPTPTEPPMEGIPLPPANGEMTNPEGAPEFSPSDANPAPVERSLPDESPDAKEQSRAPASWHGRPTSRRVVQQELPDWQMPPLPETPAAGPAYGGPGAQTEERPARNPYVFPASASRRNESYNETSNQ